MSVKSVFSLLTLSVAASFSVAACAATTDEAPAAPDEVADAELRMASYNTCKTNDDCVAVPEGGCCPHGYNVAVNKSKTEQYAKAASCKTRPQICPLYLVLDERVAQCNAGTKKCQMVKPEDIACGGFTMNPLKCPTGYSCDHTGVNPDFPGKCVKAVTPPDCTTTGCPTGKYCSACWGSMACIPNGALC